MGDISHITSRFSDISLQGSELELEIRQETWDSTTDPEGKRIHNSYVQWRVYMVEAYIPGRQEPVRAEAARTLYSRLTGEPHETYAPEGNAEAVSNLIHFFDYLAKRGARVMITHDSSGLFDEMGCLEGLDTEQAILAIVHSDPMRKTEGPLYLVQQFPSEQ